jgi:hypothetical protein
MDLLADAHTVAAPVGGTAFLLTITATAVSPEKEVFAKEETDFPRITFFKEEHPMNVESGMLINESPMVASFIFLQAKKVEFPRFFTLFGRFTLVKLLQEEKALFFMEVTELGIVTLVKSVHPSKEEVPIDTTELGMVTLVKPLHPEKVPSLMEETEDGRTALANFVHSWKA